MLNINPIKDQIKAVIINKLAPIDGLNSITFVGSFQSSTDFSLISDIDIIVIVDQLFGSKFSEIKAAASSIKGADIGLENFKIRINMTFGPLKFNDDQTVVFHIMVYDIEGHRRHVLESPFTCLDWEYFPAIYGKNLSDIYPAFGVQLEDLTDSRRGLEAYLDDLSKKVISFREYDFSIEPYSEKKHIFQIDERHQSEYAYHILKFLQLNLIKILTQENNRYSVLDLALIFSNLKPSFRDHSELLLGLHKWKYENGKKPYRIFERLEYFIKDLSSWLVDLNLPKISFFRHGKTLLNDGSFLGVRRNPPIINPIESFCNEYFDEVYSGTLQRTIETGKMLNSKAYYQNELLNEIDYGLAEGLTLKELGDRFPEIIQSWQKNEDPKFPDGECQLNVKKRLLSFLKNTFFKNKTAVITHNVVLKTLLGIVYNQPIFSWYKMNPIHLEAHNFQLFNNVLLPQFTKDQQIKYKDELVGFRRAIVKYGVFWIPNKELNQYVESWKHKIRKIEPDAIYLNHPVHSTIFLFYAFEQDQSDIISTINIGKIFFLLNGWNIFENDLITKGDTISLKFKPSKKVLEFQLNIANSLLRFVRKPILYQNTWTGDYQESYNRYGFPFVGSHWVPHLTIASVKNNGKSLIKEVESTKINVNQILCEGHLALFRISGQTHKCIHRWQ